MEKKYSLYDWVRLAVKWYSVLIILYHMFTAQFGGPEVMKFRVTHVSMFVSVAFLFFRVKRGQDKDRIPWYDFVLAILAWVPMIHIFSDYERISTRIPYVDGLTIFDWGSGLILIALVMEACRRTVGLSLVILFLLFTFHALFGKYFPGILGQSAISPTRLLDHLFMTTNGVYGTISGIVATYVLMFVLLGSVLEQAKGGELFMNMASGSMGGAKGGPAKAAVVASGLFGSISGSAVANVYATGSFTIPLMIRTGFNPRFAAAVEAVASSSGQLVPPIMGSASFLIADFTGLPYIKIIQAAILPALLYLLATYAMVHLEALKNDLPAMSPDQVQKARKDIWPAMHLVGSIALVVYFLIQRFTVLFAAYAGVICALLLSTLRSYTRISLWQMFESFAVAASRIAPIAAALYVAGLIVGDIELSGLGLRFTSILVKISGGSLLITLFLVMISCIIMGMGLPTAAAYLIVAIFSAPALIQLGVNPLAAHFFVFYYAIISGITPPVAGVAYAAASIAGTSFQKTGFTAMWLAAAVYLVPFVMIYNPAMLMIGSWGDTLRAAITGIVGIYALATTVQGYWLSRMSLKQRMLTFVSAVLLLHGGWETDLIGAVLLGIALVLEHVKRTRRRGEERGVIITEGS